MEILPDDNIFNELPLRKNNQKFILEYNPDKIIFING
jgi:hypothetical protein